MLNFSKGIAFCFNESSITAGGAHRPVLHLWKNFGKPWLYPLNTGSFMQAKISKNKNLCEGSGI